MTLHIFNPEHDIALAAGLANFTAPHAGRQLRADMGYLPAIWAAEGDAVLVDCVEVARRRYHRLRGRIGGPEVVFVAKHDLPDLRPDRVDPWGWDAALCAALRRWGVAESLLPTADELALVRDLSHRRTAARLLPLLRSDKIKGGGALPQRPEVVAHYLESTEGRAFESIVGEALESTVGEAFEGTVGEAFEGTVGEAFECTAAGDVRSLMEQYGQVVLKAPWSSSGRGIRYVDAAHFTENVERWLRRLLAQQGSVMVEPYYQKVKDFGMEFTALPDGTVRYEGLSLFHTVNGAYTGNILATESVKRRMISRYVSEELLDAVREKIMSMPDLRGYSGPFGIDMMVVSDCRDGVASRTRQFLLHPCVEINLRRTMGHVALHLSPTDDDTCKVMRIVSGDHYKLSIRKAAWRAGL